MCATMQNFSKAAEIFEDVRTFLCVIYLLSVYTSYKYVVN